MHFELREACSPEDYASARRLLGDYARELAIDLSFQGFAQELADLSRIYGGPSGCMLLGHSGEAVVACVGVRRVAEEVCEMKRLYLTEPFRGEGLGRRLVLAAMDAARRRGYRRMV